MRTTAMHSTLMLLLAVLLATASARCPCDTAQHNTHLLGDFFSPPMMMPSRPIFDYNSLFDPSPLGLWPARSTMPSLLTLLHRLPALEREEPKPPPAERPRVLHFDVSGFGDDEIAINVEGSHVVVEGESSRGGSTHRFTKSKLLEGESPPEPSRVTAVRHGDRLVVTAPPAAKPTATAVPVVNSAPAVKDASQAARAASEGAAESAAEATKAKELAEAADAAEGAAFWKVVGDAAAKAQPGKELAAPPLEEPPVNAEPPAQPAAQAAAPAEEAPQETNTTTAPANAGDATE